MHGADERPRVWLASDQQAVADAVSAALTGAGFEVVTSVEALMADGPRVPRVGLLLHALAPDACAHEARGVLARAAVPWLVVTSTPRDRGWEAVLDAGATRVVDAADTSVEMVVQLIVELALGTVPADVEGRA